MRFQKFNLYFGACKHIAMCMHAAPLTSNKGTNMKIAIVARESMANISQISHGKVSLLIYLLIEANMCDKLNN